MTCSRPLASTPAVDLIRVTRGQALARSGALECIADGDSSLLSLSSVFAGLYSLDEFDYRDHRHTQGQGQGQGQHDSTVTAAVAEGSGSLGLRADQSESQSQLQLQAVISDAVRHPAKYVMKPQREGGGNNYYGAAMTRALQTLTPHELSAFILMVHTLHCTTLCIHLKAYIASHHSLILILTDLTRSGRLTHFRCVPFTDC